MCGQGQGSEVDFSSAKKEPIRPVREALLLLFGKERARSEVPALPKTEERQADSLQQAGMGVENPSPS
jgi:hypothetical protein